MDFAFSRFERLLARPLGVVPDFPVLLAGLSASQSGSATARKQMLLDQNASDVTGSVASRVALMADGVFTPPRDTGASFNVEAAHTLAAPPRK